MTTAVGVSPLTKGSTTARSSNIDPAYSARQALTPPTEIGTGSLPVRVPPRTSLTKGSELTALVVPDDDLATLDLVGELLRDVVVERSASALSSYVCAGSTPDGRRALDYRRSVAGRFEQALQRGFHCGRGALEDELID